MRTPEIIRERCGQTKTDKEKARPAEARRARLSLKCVSGVMIHPGRRRHRRQADKVLARMFVTLHVPRRGGEQFFSALAIFREAGYAGANRHFNCLAGPD